MRDVRFDALVAHPWVGSQWLSAVRLRDGYVVGFASHEIQWGGEGTYYEDVLENWPLSCVRKWERYPPREHLASESTKASS